MGIKVRKKGNHRMEEWESKHGGMGIKVWILDMEWNGTENRNYVEYIHIAGMSV